MKKDNKLYLRPEFSWIIRTERLFRGVSIKEKSFNFSNAKGLIKPYHNSLFNTEIPGWALLLSTMMIQLSVHSGRDSETAAGRDTSFQLWLRQLTGPRSTPGGKLREAIQQLFSLARSFEVRTDGILYKAASRENSRGKFTVLQYTVG